MNILLWVITEMTKDSRMIGTIPFKDVKGTTELILFPFNRFGKVKKYN